MINAYLLTGSNMGNRMLNLSMAAGLVGLRAGAIINLSSIYETEPWGITNQPSFYNQALQVETALPPEQLLAALLSIEEEMGRVRKEKLGPRIIDIDILLLNDLVIHTASLQVPHPFLQERNFAMQPLAEIAPQLVHPILKTSIENLKLLSKDTLKCKVVR